MSNNNSYFFKNDDENFHLVGFSQAEVNGRWSCEKECSITFQNTQNAKICFEVVPYICSEKKSLKVDVFLNEEYNSSWKFNSSKKAIISIDIPKNSNISIKFVFDYVVSPKTLNLSDDNRLLGLFFEKMSFYENDVSSLDKRISNLENGLNEIKNILSNISLKNEYFYANIWANQKGLTFPIEAVSKAKDCGFEAEVIELPLSKILIERADKNRLEPLEKHVSYRALVEGKESLYTNYINSFIKRGGLSTETIFTYENLKKMYDEIKNNGYSPQKGTIILTKDNVILDGTRRCCCLLAIYGGTYKITAIRLKH